MRYTVLVAVTGDSPATHKTLQAVEEQMRSIADPGELVLALCAPRESLGSVPRASLERWADRIHFDPDSRKAGALHSAILAARGDVVVFTEEGALPQSHWLETHLDTLDAEASPFAGCAGPVSPIFPEGGAPDWIRRCFAASESFAVGPFHRLHGNPPEYTHQEGVGPLPFGINCAYHTHILHEHPLHLDVLPPQGVGLRGGEDIGLALELLCAGERIAYLPKAQVHVHLPPRRFATAYARLVFESEGTFKAHAIPEAIKARLRADWKPRNLPDRGRTLEDLQRISTAAMHAAWSPS